MKLTKTIVITGVSCLLVGGVVFAQVRDGNTANSNTKTQERVQALQEKKESLKLKNCERVEAKLANKLEIFSKKRDKQVESFTKSYEKMVTLAEKFETEGYDTTTLREHLATLDSMIKKFDSDYNLYIQTVNDSQELSCSETESTFKVKLNQSREQLGNLKAQSVSIRTYWAQTVRLDIQALKALVNADKVTDDNNASNPEETN